MESMLTIKEVARIMRISIRTLRNKLSHPHCDIPRTRIGGRGHYRFHPKKIEQYLMTENHGPEVDHRKLDANLKVKVVA